MNNINKGKYVKRSTFQKVVEENKKLRNHIAIMVKEGLPSFEKIQLVKKYREQIAVGTKLHNDIKQMLGIILEEDKKRRNI